MSTIIEIPPRASRLIRQAPVISPAPAVKVTPPGPTRPKRPRPSQMRSTEQWRQVFAAYVPPSGAVRVRDVIAKVNGEARHTTTNTLAKLARGWKEFEVFKRPTPGVHGPGSVYVQLSARIRRGLSE